MDRRLRLQALTNYQTYRNNDLVKRCLYLLAGTTKDDDRIAACVFTKPDNHADDTYMFDYSLFFISTLYDYYLNTDDMETLYDLSTIALKQLDIAAAYFDEKHLIKDSDQLGWCFVDWNLALNKQASAQAIYIYCAKTAERLAKAIGQDELAKSIHADWEKKTEAALKYLYSPYEQLFVSGDQKQISMASQVWFVLAGVLDNQEAVALLSRAERRSDTLKMVTPYMYHHYVEALYQVGETQKATSVINYYWGAMVNQGADTFYELFNPDNPMESPYGSSIVNSYCHAWSCTPSWFLRKETTLEKGVSA